MSFTEVVLLICAFRILELITKVLLERYWK